MSAQFSDERSARMQDADEVIVDETTPETVRVSRSNETNVLKGMKWWKLFNTYVILQANDAEKVVADDTAPGTAHESHSNETGERKSKKWWKPFTMYVIPAPYERGFAFRAGGFPPRVTFMAHPSGPVIKCVNDVLSGMVNGAMLGLIMSPLYIIAGINPTVWVGSSMNTIFSVPTTGGGLLRKIGSQMGRSVKAHSIWGGVIRGIFSVMETARGREDWVNLATTGAIVGCLWSQRQGGLRWAIGRTAAFGTLFGLVGKCLEGRG